MGCSDSSVVLIQLELRIMAHLSDEPLLKQMFDDGADPFRRGWSASELLSSPSVFVALCRKGEG